MEYFSYIETLRSRQGSLADTYIPYVTQDWLKFICNCRMANEKIIIMWTDFHIRNNVDLKQGVFAKILPTASDNASVGNGIVLGAE